MADLKTSNRRWTILKLLAGDVGHEVPARLIQRGLGAVNRAHKNVGLDEVRADLRWLNEKMLIELHIDKTDAHAKLVQRGADAVEGRIYVDGVDEPPLEG